MTSFNVGTDLLIDALRSVIQTNVNAELQSTYSGDVIVTTAGYPVPLELLPKLKLPTLAIYRISETLTGGGRRRDDDLSQIAFDYFGPPTPISRLDATWPLLRSVWSELVDAVCAGTLPTSTHINTLQNAGLIEAIEDSFAVTYNFATGGNYNYPFFAGRAQIQSREVPVSDAVPFTRLYVALNLVDEEGVSETELNPIVEDNLEAEVTFPTQHFNIGKIGSPAVAATPGTPDPAAMAEWSQVGIANAQTISVIHLHGIEDKGAGSMTVEIYRWRDSVHTLLGTITLTGGAGDFETQGMVPAGALIHLQAGDYLMAQLTDYSGAGGYDGITCDCHFVASL